MKFAVGDVVAFTEESKTKSWWKDWLECAGTAHGFVVDEVKGEDLDGIILKQLDGAPIDYHSHFPMFYEEGTGLWDEWLERDEFLTAARKAIADEHEHQNQSS